MEEGDLADVIAAHIAATYPWGEIKRRWNEKLATTTVPNDVIAVAVEAEVRERRFDGTWGDPRPVQPKRFPVGVLPGAMSDPPYLPDYNGTNGEEIRQIINELANNWQEEILEPSYPDILWSASEWGTWRTHLAMTSVSIGLDAEEEETTEVRQPAYDKPAPGMDLKMHPGMGAPYEPRPKIAPRAPRGRTIGPGTYGTKEFDRKMRDPKLGLKTRGAPRTGTGRPWLRGRAPIPSRQVVTPAYKEPDRPEVTPVPPLFEQMANGEVLFWMHQTTVEPSKVYQYRVRLAVVSPLVTFVGDVDDPKDAEQSVLRTPFSEWSNPVSVPRATEFFVTGHNTVRREASVTVFRRHLGQWVKEKFTVREGQLIGGTAKVRVMHPQNGNKVQEPVDFITGSVVVRLVPRTVKKRGNIPIPSVEMYYLDETGQLMTRVADADRDSQRYKQLQDEVKRTKAAVRASLLPLQRG